MDARRVWVVLPDCFEHPLLFSGKDLVLGYFTETCVRYGWPLEDIHEENNHHIWVGKELGDTGYEAWLVEVVE